MQRLELLLDGREPFGRLIRACQMVLRDELLDMGDSVGRRRMGRKPGKSRATARLGLELLKKRDEAAGIVTGGARIPGAKLVGLVFLRPRMGEHGALGFGGGDDLWWQRRVFVE